MKQTGNRGGVQLQATKRRLKTPGGSNEPLLGTLAVFPPGARVTVEANAEGSAIANPRAKVAKFFFVIKILRNVSIKSRVAGFSVSIRIIYSGIQRLRPWKSTARAEGRRSSTGY